MGYVTPILFSNDAMDVFEKYPEETVKNILEAMTETRKEQSFPVGNHCNPMQALPSRHMDEYGLIHFGGNTWIDLSRKVGAMAFTSLPPTMSVDQMEAYIKVLKQEVNLIKKAIKKVKV